MMDEVKIPKEENIIDSHKELYKSLSERMEISNKWIERAIDEIQEEDSVEKFKQEIIEAYTKERFVENEENFLNKIKKAKFEDAKHELSDFYLSWGNKLYYNAEVSKEQKTFEESIEKERRAIEFNPKSRLAYYNYGTILSKVAIINSDESLFNESFKQFEKAIELNPNEDSTYNNYAVSLSGLAKLSSNESLYRKSLKQYEKVVELNSNNYLYYSNYATTLSDLAKILADENLYKESFEQYKKAIELNSEEHLLYNNYGTSLTDLAKLTADKSLLEKSIKLHIKAYDLGANPYNLACCYSLLNDKENTLKYLKETLDRNQVTLKQINEDNDFGFFREDGDFKNLLKQYK